MTPTTNPTVAMTTMATKMRIPVVVTKRSK